MTFSIIIATYGEQSWAQLAMTRALPSVEDMDADIIVGHDDEGTIAGIRNFLARKAKGDWLVFLDADDELAPGYLEAMERAAASKCLLTPHVEKVMRGRRTRPHFYPEVNLLSGNWLVVGTALERKLFRKAGGFGEYPHGFEDWSLWYKCARLGAEVVRVPGAVYRQYVNPHSKHQVGWRNKRWQAATHRSVQAELEAWTP